MYSLHASFTSYYLWHSLKSGPETQDPETRDPETQDPGTLRLRTLELWNWNPGPLDL